ncbi:hypothetical protein OKW98_18680 [Pseudomonas sp. KU26590]|uniref:hypothetical protein n=1 Tax=Pseudomonas sp. KU26590 TaxID=2991051 RepID=UPI00223D75F6|nr:hypothetical protein [Pseudomonas sp. KU26590]UZJ58604.1 hypothetical protein OKW98_18680 [Pseudomonas sp. KU26590]
MRWDAHRAAEPEVAKSLHQFKEAGVYAAAKALGRSTRSINRIAQQHGIEFSTPTKATSERRRAERDALAAKIKELAGTRSQAQICEALGITRAILREIAEIHFIDIDSRKRA